VSLSCIFKVFQFNHIYPLGNIFLKYIQNTILESVERRNYECMNAVRLDTIFNVVLVVW
jgi:hypothetical protein